MENETLNVELMHKRADRLPAEELAEYIAQATIFHDRFVEHITPLLEKEKTPTIKPGLKM